MQVSINEAIQGREERVLAIKHDGTDAPYLVKCVRPYRQAAGASEAASNWRDNTASQNMFLNIFFLHPTMHRGAFAELMGFPCFLCPGLAIAGLIIAGAVTVVAAVLLGYGLFGPVEGVL